MTDTATLRADLAAMERRALLLQCEIDRLTHVIDDFVNVDLPMDDCSFCDYNPKSVTPFDGHEAECSIRKLAEVLR